MNKQTVIIVGAGAAGLMAARELAEKYSVIILEAADRLGGRIHSIPSKVHPFIIESGAEFIHGHLPVTLQLLREAGIKYVPVAGNMYRKEKGQWKKQTDFIENWDVIIEKMKETEADMTMADFLQQYFADAQYADLRHHIIAFAEGFDLADINTASMKALYKEWSHEEGSSYRIPEGYSALVHFLQQECEKKRCRIITHQTVKQIDWEEGKVKVYGTDGQQFYAHKVIITVPINVLRKAGGKASINFTPALDDQIRAVNDIGMGGVIRIAVECKEVVWPADMGFAFSDEIFPTWWAQLPDKSPVLMGWAGGTKAERMSELPEEEILQKALLSLAALLDKSSDELKANIAATHVFNWSRQPYTLGAYTFDTPKSKAARELITKPIANTVFFAGEGLYSGDSPGTVEAALVSGKEVAGRLL